jgi:hypothetical protein
MFLRLLEAPEGRLKLAQDAIHISANLFRMFFVETPTKSSS